MRQSSKAIWWVAGGLVVIFAGVWLVGKLHPLFARHHLAHRLEQIEPWTASADYSEAGWKKLMAAAADFQKAKPAYVDSVLSDHLRNPADPTAQGQAYLLMRMMFDLPSSAPPGTKPPFAEWTDSPKTNADGTVNLAWPLVLTGGGPHLAAGRGATSGTYSARDEYDYLRYHYHFRSLAGLAK